MTPPECEQLEAERDQLRAEVARLEKECAEHKQAVIDAMALSNEMDAHLRQRSFGD